MTKDNAFSGLEAAIVLIAFVVVAAVFSYVMLGAGFFATQKSQEVTYSGISQATSNLVLDGQIYGFSSPLARVEFNIGIPEGGQAQKLASVKFVTTVEGGNLAEPTATFWDKLGASVATSHVLGAGEKVTVSLPFGTKPTAGQSFTIEMKPLVGASTMISKTLATGYSAPGGIII